MTPDALRAHTRRELAAIARNHRLNGWHAMRKEQLIEALIEAGRGLRSESRSKPPQRRQPAKVVVKPLVGAAMPTSQVPERRAPAGHAARRRLVPSIACGAPQDSLTVVASDPFWLNASWTLTPKTLKRAETALRHEWHRAVPILRLFDVTSGDEGRAHQTWLRDIEIHGEVDHWYVAAGDPPRSYRLEIGYRAPNGRFFVLARSRTVTTWLPGGRGTSGKRWTQATAGTAGQVPDALRRRADFLDGHESFGGPHPGGPALRLDAEVIVSGSATPGTELSFLGEPVQLAKDGSFALHFRLPDGRHIVPVIGVSEGGEQRTIVLAFERNTKELAPPEPGDFLG